MSQNGKGMAPRKGYNYKKYSEGFDAIIRCDICGRFVSSKDLEAGVAVRQLLTPDSDYSTEEYETYHIKCRKA